MPAAPAPRQHLQSLEAIRGLAALWVMVGHGLSWMPFAPAQARPQISRWWEQALDVLTPGHLGVVLFFLLSGYVLGKAYPAARSLQPGVYAAKRWVRLWPCFACSILIGCLVVPPAATQPVLEALLLVRDWIPQNPVIWSVCYEFWFYATLPLIFLAPAHQRRMLAAALLLICGLLTLLGYTMFTSGVPVVGPWITGLALWLLGLLCAWCTGPADPQALPHPRFLGALLLLIALEGCNEGLQGVASALQLDWQLSAGRIWLLDLASAPLALMMAAALLGLAARRWWRLAWWGSLLLILMLQLGVALQGNWLASGNWWMSLLLSALATLLWRCPTITGTAAATRAILRLAPVGAISYGLYVFHMPLMTLVGRIPRLLPAGPGVELVLRITLALGLVVGTSAGFDLGIQPVLRRLLLARLIPAT